MSKVDPKFFIRLKESALYREDKEDEFSLFCDVEFSDKDYHKLYPTIHHLIYELMVSPKPHDVRLVYLALAWLVKHRGHFLSKIDINNISSIKSFDHVYAESMKFFEDKGVSAPWECEEFNSVGEILKANKGVTVKTALFKDALYKGAKIPKEPDEDFPYSREGIIKLLAGGSYKAVDLFGNEDYAEVPALSLKLDDDKFAEIASAIGDDFELIVALRKLYDWATLVEVMGEYGSISEAKIATYERHKTDLEWLKGFVRAHISSKYDELFKKEDGGKYGSYVKGGKGTLNLEDFSKYLLGLLKNVSVDGSEAAALESAIARIELRTFLPKQKNTDNRVIPHQLYQYELKRILENATAYLPFLKDKTDGYTVAEKIEKIFTFRIPYFVGPLNKHSEHAWLKRFSGAEGKIYPWNFEDIVDFDASEQEFIRRMTNKCTYLPDEDVLPKCSLLYQKFVVLNEINNIRINNERISVELKQDIYKDLFLKNNKVSRKKVIGYLLANNHISKGQEDLVTGVDINLNGNLSSWRAFNRMLSEKILSEADVERIINRSTYSEDKTRLRKWIEKEYPQLSKDDINYICGIRLKDFGRLSERFLNGIEGIKNDTGEVLTIIGALWNTQNNLNEIILTKDYSFKEVIAEINRDYYAQNKKTLADRLDDMYISNAVRRPIYRSLAILKDIEKAFGKPDKIFVEMARGSDGKEKGKRKDSRLEQILNLYKECKDTDIKDLKKQLEDMGEYANNKLQSDKLFLYYMQLGKCMYTGKPIKIEELGTKLYDIDHIYPQSYVTDDSILNNKVLVLSEANGAKSNVYPISSEIRFHMAPFWKHLYYSKLITEAKYKRLVRSTPFTDNEKQDFINRQFVETTQATKAVATIVGDRYPDAEIVYCKAKYAAEFRHEFNIYKSRSFNDLHHAVDAYINIATGNVYNMKFTKKWFSVNSNYSVNPKTVFTHDVTVNGEEVWNTKLLEKVKKQAVKNTAHIVKYSYFKHGGLFDQMPVAKAEGLVPRKKGLDTEKYGGYKKAGAMFYIPVRYKQGKKSSVMVMSVELLHGDRFLTDEKCAREYSFTRLEHILGKPVEDVEFPMGMRPWKVNTVLSLDGYRVCITGIANGGQKLLAQGMLQFSDKPEWNYYIGKIEKFAEKVKNNPKYKYDEVYDKISPAKNLELYDLYIKKYEGTLYAKRMNKPYDILKDGREKFKGLPIEVQAQTLLNIHSTFGRSGSSGTDLASIGGATRSAVTTLGATISNWAKNYKDIRIIDMSPSGLWEKQSINLLELI